MSLYTVLIVLQLYHHNIMSAAYFSETNVANLPNLAKRCTFHTKYQLQISPSFQYLGQKLLIGPP